MIISLALGDKKKRGSHFDLGMIIALLYQTDQIAPKNLGDYAFIGELSLDGRIRPCTGVLSMITKAALSDKLFVIDAGRSSGTRSKQQLVFLPADDKEQEKKSSPKGAENVFSAL